VTVDLGQETSRLICHCILCYYARHELCLGNPTYHSHVRVLAHHPRQCRPLALRQPLRTSPGPLPAAAVPQCGSIATCLARCGLTVDAWSGRFDCRAIYATIRKIAGPLVVYVHGPFYDLVRHPCTKQHSSDRRASAPRTIHHPSAMYWTLLYSRHVNPPIPVPLPPPFLSSHRELWFMADGTPF
jgi:hypothetical protein